MKILYRVQTVPGREEPLARLSARLPAGREAILDSEHEDPNPWRGYRRCLTSLGDASHVVVLQDDTIACRNFPETIERLVEARPASLISLFVGGLPGRSSRNFMRALTNRRPWVQIETRPALHVVGMIWPAALAVEFLEWSETAVLPGHRGVPRSDDAVVGHWVRTRRVDGRRAPVEIWATVPSLIQHPDDVPSVAGHNKAAYGRDRGRIALAWIGAEADPLEIDWAAT